MTKDVCIEIIRRRINSCMEEIFNEDSKTAHNIAQDFSKTNLDTFVHEYCNSLHK